ncbi:hypothetical protein AB1N83_010108 [Pleurotus pulmonarius]
MVSKLIPEYLMSYVASFRELRYLKVRSYCILAKMLASAKHLRATKVEFVRLEIGYSYDPGAIENARETIKNLFDEIPTLNLFDCIQIVFHAEGLRFKRDELDRPNGMKHRREVNPTLLNTRF